MTEAIGAVRGEADVEDDIAKIERVGDGNAGERYGTCSHHLDAKHVNSKYQRGYATVKAVALDAGG